MIIGKDKVILSLCTTVSQFLHSNSEDEQLRQNLTEGSPDVRQEMGSPPSPCSSGFAPGSATPLGVDGRECCPPALGGGAWLCKQGRACWRAHVCSTVLPTPQTSSQRKRRTRWEGRAITVRGARRNGPGPPFRRSFSGHPVLTSPVLCRSGRLRICGPSSPVLSLRRMCRGWDSSGQASEPRPPTGCPQAGA